MQQMADEDGFELTESKISQIMADREYYDEN